VLGYTTIFSQNQKDSNMKRFIVLVLVIYGLLLTGCRSLGGLGGGEDAVLTPIDIMPNVGQYVELLQNLGAYEKLQLPQVTYKVTNNNSFDPFLKKAAVVNGTVMFLSSITANVTQNLKKIARDGAANTEIKKQQDAILAGREFEAVSIEEQIACSKLTYKSREMTDNEKKYFGNLVLLFVPMADAAKNVAGTISALSSEATSLTANAKSLGPMESANVLPAISSSAKNISSAGTNLPPLIKDVGALSVGIKSMLGS
jgi:hypothetical protein